MDATLNLQRPKRTVISNGVMAMVFIICTEVMLFAALISALVVNRSSVSVWPPIGQPRLPVEVTAINTLVLLFSGLTIFLFGRNYRSRTNGVSSNKPYSLKLLVLTMILGFTFVAIQGVEWARLIGFGLTTTSSIYGAFFYLLIGAHGLHVIAGLIILVYLLGSIKRSESIEEATNKITVCSMYWYLVVGIWPILYVLVYLS